MISFTCFFTLVVSTCIAADALEPITKSDIRVKAATTYVRSNRQHNIADVGRTSSALGPRSLECTIDNSWGKIPLDLTVEVFWIGKGLRSVIKKETVLVSVEAKKNHKFTSSIEDPQVKFYHSDAEGWVIVVRDTAEKKLLAVNGNLTPLEQLARTPNALDALLKRNSGR